MSSLPYTFVVCPGTTTPFIHTHPNYISEIQCLQSATYYSSNALQIKFASDGPFKFTNVPETGCLPYKGSDDTNHSVFATPDAAVSLADVLLKSVAMEASRHIFNIICFVHCEYNHPHTPTKAQFT
jgi:hypothetical protein